MNFKEFLNEMAPLGPAHEKKFKEIGKEIKYQERYKELFGNKDRIYIKVSGSVKPKFNDDLKDEIEDNISAYQYFLGNKDGDYYSVIKPLNFIKTGTVGFYKIVNGKKIIKNIKVEEILKLIDGKNEREKYINMWKYTPKKDVYDDLSVVISRNPCDIAGMSTNRGWKSCMNLYTGEYSYKVKQDVKEGTLVVYLIDSKDKDIIYPLGRKLIKPYISKDKKTILKLTEPTYGNKFPSSAIKEIQNWLDEYQKDIKGFFEPHKKLYTDRGEEDVYIGKKIKFNVGDKVRIKREFLMDNHYLPGTIGIVKNSKKGDKIGISFSAYHSGYDLDGILKGRIKYSGLFIHPYKLIKVEE